MSLLFTNGIWTERAFEPQFEDGRAAPKGFEIALETDGKIGLRFKLWRATHTAKFTPAYLGAIEFPCVAEFICLPTFRDVLALLREVLPVLRQAAELDRLDEVGEVARHRSANGTESALARGAQELSNVPAGRGDSES